MIYTKQEKKLIRKFVKIIDPKIKVSFEEKDFQADPQQKIVFVGNHCSHEFMKWFKQEFKQVEDMNWWLIHILHEIGHCEIYTKKAQCERAKAVANIEIDQFFGNIKNNHDANIQYFNIENEYGATSWGINYYLRFKKELNEFVSSMDY